MCERQYTKKYTERPSPPYPAQECKHDVKRGNDGNLYMSDSDINGIFKWKLIKNPRGMVEENWRIESTPFNYGTTAWEQEQEEFRYKQRPSELRYARKGLSLEERQWLAADDAGKRRIEFEDERRRRNAMIFPRAASPPKAAAYQIAPPRGYAPKRTREEIQRVNEIIGRIAPKVAPPIAPPGYVCEGGKCRRVRFEAPPPITSSAMDDLDLSRGPDEESKRRNRFFFRGAPAPPAPSLPIAPLLTVPKVVTSALDELDLTGGPDEESKRRNRFFYKASPPPPPPPPPQAYQVRQPNPAYQVRQPNAAYQVRPPAKVPIAAAYAAFARPLQAAAPLVAPIVAPIVAPVAAAVRAVSPPRMFPSSSVTYDFLDRLDIIRGLPSFFGKIDDYIREPDDDVYVKRGYGQHAKPLTLERARTIGKFTKFWVLSGQDIYTPESTSEKIQNLRQMEIIGYGTNEFNINPDYKPGDYIFVREWQFPFYSGAGDIFGLNPNCKNKKTGQSYAGTGSGCDPVYIFAKSRPGHSF